MKVREREEARRLRADLGLPLGEIATRLGVAKSSVSLWVRDIELTPQQIEALRAANPIFNLQGRGQDARSQGARRLRLQAQADGRRRTRAADGLHRAGCMLYWAEGSKRRNSVTFVNSDPEMHRLFVRFLRRCYDVPREAFRLSVNCHLSNGLTLDDVEAYWLEQLSLPRSCLRQATVNVASGASKRLRRTLPYGTARVTVNSTFVVQSIYGAIQEYGRFEREEWLDCRS